MPEFGAPPFVYAKRSAARGGITIVFAIVLGEKRNVRIVLATGLDEERRTGRL